MKKAPSTNTACGWTGPPVHRGSFEVNRGNTFVKSIGAACFAGPMPLMRLRFVSLMAWSKLVDHS
eukprot:3208596-Amphidinium_carterae.1